MLLVSVAKSPVTVSMLACCRKSYYSADLTQRRDCYHAETLIWISLQHNSFSSWPHSCADRDIYLTGTQKAQWFSLLE